MKTQDRLLCRSMDWAEVRQFIAAKPQFAAEAMGLDSCVLRDILDRKTAHLSRSLLREMCVWVDGYENGKCVNEGEKPR